MLECFNVIFVFCFSYRSVHHTSNQNIPQQTLTQFPEKHQYSVTDERKLHVCLWKIFILNRKRTTGRLKSLTLFFFFKINKLLALVNHHETAKSLPNSECRTFAIRGFFLFFNWGKLKICLVKQINRRSLKREEQI